MTTHMPGLPPIRATTRAECCYTCAYFEVIKRTERCYARSAESRIRGDITAPLSSVCDLWASMWQTTMDFDVKTGEPIWPAVQ